MKMPRKDDRCVLSPLGEWYEDLLSADAAINARSMAMQGNSLLCAKLQERYPVIKERIQYLADKRGITFQECWKLCVTGRIEKITPDEWVDMPGKESEE
ncbi:hypothetical protein NIES2101_41865 [Calothrix sp. HK-06]|nr:hypothetical protein NIES2101_41865 [Calothrix sp. HK-06]